MNAMKQFFLATLVIAAMLCGTQVAAQGLSDEARLQQARADMAKLGELAEIVSSARSFSGERDWLRAAVAWERAATLRPHVGRFLYEAAAHFALAGDLTHAYNALLILQTRGHGFDLESDERLKNLQGTGLWDYLAELNRDALSSDFGGGELAFELPPADLLLESIAWDPSSEAFLFGSARDGVIYRYKKGGQDGLQRWSEPQGDLWWSIFDVKVDAARNLVWATTAAVPHFKGFSPTQGGQSALLKIDLRTGRLIRAMPVPEDGLPHILNGIAISDRGQVVVAEGMRGQMFIVEGDSLAPLMAEPQLNALRGMTFSPNGRVLYFSDHERGLFGLDLSNRMAFDVKVPNNVALDGIEGLHQFEGQLIAIQNGMRPQRVMRFKLDESGREILMGVPIEANRKEFSTPTLGTLVGDDLFFIANSQRRYYDGYGLLRGAVESLPPVRIFRSDARFNWDFEPPRLPESIAPRVPDELMRSEPPTGGP